MQSNSFLHTTRRNHTKAGEMQRRKKQSMFLAERKQGKQRKRHSKTKSEKERNSKTRQSVHSENQDGKRKFCKQSLPQSGGLKKDKSLFFFLQQKNEVAVLLLCSEMRVLADTEQSNTQSADQTQRFEACQVFFVFVFAYRLSIVQKSCKLSALPFLKTVREVTRPQQQ